MPSRESKANLQIITRRERAILNLIAEGYKNKEIANELYISQKTVRENQVNLIRKLNARNISSVIDYALEKGLISIYEVLESRFSRRKFEVSPVRNSSRSTQRLSTGGALTPALRGGAPYGAEPGIILKSNPAAAAGPEGLPPGHEPFRGGAWPGGSSVALFLTG